MKIKILFLVACSVLCTLSCKRQQRAAYSPDRRDLLRHTLDSIIRSYDARIGLALLAIEDRDTFSINGGQGFPMQSVYKFPQALVVLKLADEGKLKLDQKIMVTRADLHPDTWSPLREKYPEGNIEISIAALLEYTVSKSDNNTCDILFGLYGGPAAFNRKIHDWGFNDMEIASTEYEMRSGWDLQYKNRVSPQGIVRMLDEFYKKKLLSDSSSAFLMKLMTETSNSAARIKGLLPEDIAVAHKTGTSAEKDGLIAAVNDVGIITLPDGRHLALAVFVSQAHESYDTCDSIIAVLSETIFDFCK